MHWLATNHDGEGHFARLTADGSCTAQVIDYSLNHRAVPIDDKLIEQQIKPWKLSAKSWLFIGSELAD